MSRRLKTQEELAQERKARSRFQPVQLPLDKLLLAYGRQSTIDQVIHNKESARQQAIELLNYALELGWTEANWKLFIENKLIDGTIKNASGRLRIDEREGLAEIYRLIREGLAGAVLVRKVDRLFRDQDMTEPTTFAKACREHQVLILTLDGDVFDFAHKPKDYERFLKEAQEAANYLRHITDMNNFRHEKGLRGEFCGHGVPTGVMLDDEHIHYVPNPLWAPVMDDLLRRFRELEGNFAQLRREIVGKPIFPELPPEILAKTGKIYLTKVPGGYTVHSHVALKNMLMNVALIGHMQYDGALIKNTHAASVDEKNFWYAWERLSTTDIDGTPIERAKPTIRYQQKNNDVPCTALLQGTRADGRAVITSTGGKSVNLLQHETEPANYVLRDNHKPLKPFIASVPASELDAIFTERLLERLDTHQENIAVIEEEIAQYAQDEDEATDMRSMAEHDRATLALLQEVMQREEKPTQLVSVDDSIAESRKKLAELKRKYDINSDLMTDKELRENKEGQVRLAKRIAELERKETEAEATEQDKQEVDVLLQDVYAIWPTLKPEKQLRYVRLITSSIDLETFADGWMLLTITWSPHMGFNEIDVAYMWRQASRKPWTPEEDQVLRSHYATASRMQLLEMLPRRSWYAIKVHVAKLGLSRGFQRSDSTLPIWMSVEDKRVMDEYGLELSTPEQRVWWRRVSTNNERSLTGYPSAAATPELVVAMARNPACSKMRALAASHALGKTRTGGSE